MSEKSYWLAFSVFPGIGPAKFFNLLSFFGSAANAWNAPLSELRASKIGGTLPEQLVDFRKTFDVQVYEEKLKKEKVNYLTSADTTYPHLLKSIKNPPIALFTKGDFNFGSSFMERTFAIVGTRKLTSYGRQVTEFLTHQLVDAGFTIVSGLAMGVDAVAHRATVESNGKTIAVLGCGVDCCNPAVNRSLYNSILERGGAIVSEYPLSAEPTKGSFPSRNRIIAGLSLGVMVTEGAEDSGSLITARNAHEFGRKVFAVPGPITSQLSRGSNALIREGAKMVADVNDILKELSLTKRLHSTKRIEGETKDEQRIIDLLMGESLHFDELARRSKIGTSQLGAVLSMLEMKGVVQGLESGIYGLSDDSI